MGLKVVKNIVLPRIDRIQDPETRRVLQHLMKAIQDMNSTYYNDLNYLYKEGEWTPALKFGGNSVGITYSVQEGLYAKIGRKVTITARIILSAKGTSTGNVQITGLPFTAIDTDSAFSIPSLLMWQVTFANVFQSYIAKNTSIISLQEVTENGAGTWLTNANFANDSQIILTATYFTDEL